MGSSHSSTESDHYGKWQDHTPCNCGRNDPNHLIITLMKRKSVPMTTRGAVIGSSAARGAVIGLVEVCYLSGQQLSHTCIQFSVICIKCKWKGCCTTDYNSTAGANKRFGKYCKTYNKQSTDEYRPKQKFTMYDFNKEFKDNYDCHWDGKDYDLGNRNCKSYAKHVYDHISTKYSIM